MQRINRFFSVFCLALALSAKGGDLPITVEESGAKDVDKLVTQLISERPAPYPSGCSEEPPEVTMSMPYMTAQVSNAMTELKKMGPPIAPALVKHLNDDRYSFSDIVAAWVNYNVGHAVIEILCDGHYMYGGYKFRKTPSGSAVYLSFENYLLAKDPVKWAEWAKTRTQLEIQNDFIDWCVKKEHERGFVDAAQEREVLGAYEQGRKEAQKDYAKQN